MEIPDSEIKRFQELYRRNFGREIGHKEAYRLGLDLIEFIRLVYEPKNENDYAKNQRFPN